MIKCLAALEGPPASGKGTIARQLESRYGFAISSLGDYFRAHPDDPRCREAGRYTATGYFAPDDLINPMMIEGLEKAEAASIERLVTDGQPRTRPQGDAMYEWAQEHEVETMIVFRLVLPDSEPDKRRQKRVEEAQRAGKALRDDDKDPAIFQARMGEYKTHTGGLRDFCAGKGILYEIDAMGTPEEVFARIEKALNGLGIYPLPLPPVATRPAAPSP